MAHEYEFPMAAVTATMAVVDNLHADDIDDVIILLAKRNDDSGAFPGYWCLPGGFLDVGTEDTKGCATREMKEECNVTVDENDWHLICVDDTPKGTDPRYLQVVNICYGVEKDAIGDWDNLSANDDVQEVKMITLGEINEIKLAFNHNNIVRWTIDALRGGTQK